MNHAARSRPRPGTIACENCSTPLRIFREPHRYTIHADWAVTIEDAEVRRCPKCGHHEVVIPRPQALNRTIAAAVIRKQTRLAGPEMVFLRSQMGLTARALARVMGVVPESISRWETGALPVSPPVDRLLRTMVALTIDGEKLSVQVLADIAGEAGPLKLVVTLDPKKGAWRCAA